MTTPPTSRTRIPLALVPSGFLEGLGGPSPSVGVSATSAMPRVVDMSGTWSQEDDERMRKRLSLPLQQSDAPGDDTESASDGDNGDGNVDCEAEGARLAKVAWQSSNTSATTHQRQGSTAFHFTSAGDECQRYSFYVYNALLRVSLSQAELADDSEEDDDDPTAYAGADTSTGVSVVRADNTRGLYLLPRLLRMRGPASATCAILMLKAGDFAAAVFDIGWGSVGTIADTGTAVGDRCADNDGAGDDRVSGQYDKGAAAAEAMATKTASPTPPSLWPAGLRKLASASRSLPPTLLHSTAHRYTTRRKAGGAQSAADNRNGAHKSAGATLRRYNERALAETVNKLVAEWSAILRRCVVVVLVASARSRQSLYAAADAAARVRDPKTMLPKTEGAPATATKTVTVAAAATGPMPFQDRVPANLPYGRDPKDCGSSGRVTRDPRVVRPSFPTVKPGLGECQRIVAQLCALHFVPPDEADMVEPACTHAPPPETPMPETVKDDKVANAKAKEDVEGEVEPSPWMPNALLVCSARGDVHGLQSALTKLTISEAADAGPDTDTTGLPSLEVALSERTPSHETLQGLDGFTPLHAAAARGGKCGAECVTLLLEAGADPCARDLRGRTPYNICGSGTAALVAAATMAITEGRKHGSCEQSEDSNGGTATNIDVEVDLGDGALFRGGAAAVQQAFRAFRGVDGMEARFDWDAAAVPPAITAASAEAKKLKDAEKRRRKKQRQKEARKVKKQAAAAEHAAAAEKAAADAAAEAAAAAGRKCDGCGKGMAAAFEPLRRLTFQYCGSACVLQHKRKLALDAAERRQKQQQ